MSSELRLVLRGLRRSPLTAALATAALAAGIAVTASIFTIARAVLMRGLPYPDGDRIAVVWRGTAADRDTRGAISPPDYLDVREQAASFEYVAAVNSFATTWLPEDDEPELIQLGVVAGDLFGVLRVSPLLGRTLTPADERPVNPGGGMDVGVIVLSYTFWQRAFSGDSSVLGRTLDFGGDRMAVVGVMPPGFQLHMPAGAGMSTDLIGWTPLGINYSTAPRDGAYLRLLARLRPGVTFAQAQAELDLIAGRLVNDVAQHAETGLVLRAAPLEHEVTAHIRPVLILLSATGGLLLLVACANAATLFLLRFMSRRHDAAIRRSLGAGPAAVLRPLVLEAALLALTGAIVGLLLANPAIRLLLQLEPDIVPRLHRIAIDGYVVATALAATLLLALLCGVIPGVLATRGTTADALRAQRAITTPGTRLARRALIVVQSAAAFVLLFSSVSLTATLLRLQRADLGFSHDRTLTARVTLPSGQYRGPDSWVRFFRDLTMRLSSAPGIAAAALTSDLPLYGELTLEPYAPAELAGVTEWGRFTSLHRIVGPGYFAALAVPVHAGRDFTAYDRDDSPAVAIVDAALAASLARDGVAVVGRRLLVTVHEFESGYRVAQRPVEIVGVVGSVPQEHPDAPRLGTIYLPHAQYPLWSMIVAVRGVATTPAPDMVRATIDQLDPGLPLSSVRPLSHLVTDRLAPTTFILTLVAILATAVIVLTAAGLFGVVADTGRERRREFGIRMALGDTAGAISGRLLRDGVVLSVLGMLAGLLLAPAVSRMLAGGLAAGAGLSPTAVALAGASLLAISALACMLPAWRAGRIDLLTTLREE